MRNGIELDGLRADDVVERHALSPESEMSIAHGDASSVAPGDGKVLTIGGQRVAVHRTPEKKLIKVSAYCTHMGCLVRWNGAASTWDCPCHGSRFSPEGHVIGGPAEAPLEPL